MASADVELLTDKEKQAALKFVEKVRQLVGDRLVTVVLFGSRARGEAEPDSDMDILVVVSDVNPEIQKAIHYLAAEVWLDCGIFLSTLVWSEAHQHKVESLRTLLYQNILRDGLNLLELHHGVE